MKKGRKNKAIFGAARFVICSTLAAAVMLVALMGLAGCSDSKTQAATQSLEATLAAIQGQDIATIEEYLDAVWFDPDLYSVSNDAFIGAYFADFIYEIQGAEENADGTVTVTATMTSKIMAQVLDDLYAATEAAYAEPASSDTIQDASPYFLEYASQHTWDTSENSYEIVMTQGEDGSWQIANTATFGAILLNGYDPRQIMS